MDIRAKWGRLVHYSTDPGPPGLRSRRQRSEQNRTSSQQRSHFLRQENGRPQAMQGLEGRSALGTAFPALAFALWPRIP